MHVSFNPNVSFKQSTAFPMMDASRAYFMTLPQTNGAQTAMPVVVVANPELKEEKEEKKGGFRNTVANIAKFFTTTSEMTKASVKALYYGVVAGATTLAGFWAFGALPKQMNSKTIKKAFTEPFKSISTKGKVIAAVAALAVGSVQIIKGVLRSNKRAADVEHQLDVEHKTA